MLSELLLLAGWIAGALIFTAFGYMYGRMRGIEDMLGQRAEWIQEAEDRNLIEWYETDSGNTAWRWKDGE